MIHAYMYCFRKPIATMVVSNVRVTLTSVTRAGEIHKAKVTCVRLGRSKEAHKYLSNLTNKI